MKQYILGCLVALCITIFGAGVAAAQGVGVYQLTNPYISTTGNFTGTLSGDGTYRSPYYSATKTVSNTITADTVAQKILGWQYSVSVQFTYTKTSGTPSGVITTEVSNDTGTISQGNYTVLYTDSVRNASGAQSYNHVVNGWPYSKIRLRYAGSGAPNSGSYVGCIIIR